MKRLLGKLRAIGDLFSLPRAASTKDSTVFALQRNESPLEKAILVARAKREQVVHAFLASASSEDKEEFALGFHLLDQVTAFHLSVSERLLLFIDNNVLQDIIAVREGKQREGASARFHALLAFLALMEDYYVVDVFACVSPAVMYEASHRGKVDSTKAIEQVRLLLAQVGLRMHFVGFSDPKELRQQFVRIRRDEKEIRKGLDAIKAVKWKRDFSSKGVFGGTDIPFAVAEDECPEVRLAYFHPGVVKMLLMNIIEKRMYEQNKDQPKARKMMADPQRAEFSVLFPRKDGVEGLGDIELLMYCDLIHQTQRNAIEITAGITFDRTLLASLMRRTGEHHTITIEGGVDDVEDSGLRFAYMMKRSERRRKKAERRAAEYEEGYRRFVQTVLKEHFPRDDEGKKKSQKKAAK